MTSNDILFYIFIVSVVQTFRKKSTSTINQGEILQGQRTSLEIQNFIVSKKPTSVNKKRPAEKDQ